MNKLYIFKNQGLEYPEINACGSPTVKYPEYLFEAISNKNNIYDAIRTSFYEMGLDLGHYNTKEWNPLGEYIKMGDTVLIKPNLVFHKNLNPSYNTNCVYTNPSLVRVIVDYSLIALKNTGKIIIADAPVQSCDWNTFYETSGYKEIVEFYLKNNISIPILDLRHYSARFEKNIVVREEQIMPYSCTMVDLGDSSLFGSLNNKEIELLRITDYDPSIMSKHHTTKKHEYAVSQIALEANVIINMPKIKTHRLAGMTASLKNIVGINTDKDYLPHHRKGDASGGGDQHDKHSVLDIIYDNFLDLMNHAIGQRKYYKARLLKVPLYFVSKYRAFRKFPYVPYGNWHGNDTIWRMVADLNKIVQFVDKSGKICETPQRRILIVGDMVYGGQGEGPLSPEPVKSGTILIGDNSVLFDMLAAKSMGFDYNEIPSIINAKSIFNVCANSIKIKSNVKELDSLTIDEIPKDQFRCYKPPKGWDILNK